MADSLPHRQPMAPGRGLLARFSWLLRSSSLLRAIQRGRADSYVAYLQRAAANPSIQALRARARAHLNLSPGQRVVDVGCGPGTSTVEFARLVGDRGHVFGIDPDSSMISAANAAAAEARVSAWTTHQVGDCAALPFAAATFDACYCERVLQHVRDPGPSIAIGEALRILEPGGRLVLADTDWTTLTINADETRLERLVAAAHLSRFANPSSGGRLQRQLIDAGAEDVTAETFFVTIASETATGLLSSRDQAALLRSVLSRSERSLWRESLARARAASLPYGQVTMVLAAGMRIR